MATAIRALIQTKRFIVGNLLAAQLAGGTSSVSVAPTAAPAVTSATVHHSRLGVPSGSAVTPTLRAGSGASGDRGGIKTQYEPGGTWSVRLPSGSVLPHATGGPPPWPAGTTQTSRPDAA